MPNAVPYGIIHSYDELPQDTYNKIQPDPSTIGDIVDAYSFWYWHKQNPKARINLMLGLDMLDNGYTPNPNGIDGSWKVHGSKRLANASNEWKDWLKSIEGTWIGYGVHAYHHDHPWVHEFSTITNTTWIDATWKKIIEDIYAIGLKNQTWFKAPGYRMRPQGLDILTKYGLKGYNVNREEPPEAVPKYFYIDKYGRKLILFSSSLSLDLLKEGKTPSYIYNNLIKGNLTKLGLIYMAGHFINQTIYPIWEDLFNRIETEFDVDYFLVEEIIDYWYKVLLPLKYTYNSTAITYNIDDPRLTFRLINSTITITKGLRYDDETFTLYAPNIKTGTLIFTRLSGYATISNLVETENNLSFTILAPPSTTVTARIHLSERGRPSEVFGATSWSYNPATNTLTMNIFHEGLREITITWKTETLRMNSLDITENALMAPRLNLVVQHTLLHDLQSYSKEFVIRFSRWFNESNELTRYNMRARS